MTDALETESDRTRLGRVAPNCPVFMIRGKWRPLSRSQYTEQTNEEVRAATPGNWVPVHIFLVVV